MSTPSIDILIVSCGITSAGTSAASKAKRIDPSADVKIIQENVVSYGACGIPYVIEGIINNFEELVDRPADVSKSKYDIDIIINTRAYKLDTVEPIIRPILPIEEHLSVNLALESFLTMFPENKTGTGSALWVFFIQGVE